VCVSVSSFTLQHFTSFCILQTRVLQFSKRRERPESICTVLTLQSHVSCVRVHLHWAHFIIARVVRTWLFTLCSLYERTCRACVSCVCVVCMCVCGINISQGAEPPKGTTRCAASRRRDAVLGTVSPTETPNTHGTLAARRQELWHVHDCQLDRWNGGKTAERWRDRYIDLSIDRKLERSKVRKIERSKDNARQRRRGSPSPPGAR